MVIKKSDPYKNQLKIILEYIAKDNISAMIKFRRELNQQIGNLINSPYKYRKSFYFGDENIRDMVFKGYTIIYEINDSTIEIQSIFNQNLPIREK